MSDGRRVQVWRVFLAAAVIGTVLGVGISSLRDRLAHAPRPTALALGLPPGVSAAPVPPPRTAAPLPSANARLLALLPAYPNAHEPLPLLDEPQGTGGEMKLAWFTTPDSPRDVLDYYENSFREMGVVTLSHDFSEHAGYTGWLEPDFERLHLVTAVRQGSQTVVFASLNDPMKMISRARPQPDGVPEPPHAQRGVHFDVKEGEGAQSFYWTTQEGSVEELVAFYKRELGNGGWHVDSASESGLHGRVDASRARQTVSVWVEKRKTGDVAVSVTIIGKA